MNHEHQYKLKSRLAYTENAAKETYVCIHCDAKYEQIINDNCQWACTINWQNEGIFDNWTETRL